MIAVIFEFTVAEGRGDDYFAWAERLRDEVAGAEGFVSIERFESLSAPGKYVSLSYWRDLDAVRAWRANTRHQAAQADGRDGIFASFRLKTVQVLREITLDGDGRRGEHTFAEP